MIAIIDEPPHARPQILFIDAFDSFSNNITGLLEECLDADVTLVHIDNKAVSKSLETFVQDFDAVVIGPGPGHPANPEDVGFISRIWKLSEANLVPVLGICLGFQSLCLAYGAEVTRLRQARHGIVSRVSNTEGDIWEGIENCDATQYHSLHVKLSSTTSPPFWHPTKSCPKLQPLAWDLSDDLNGPILSSVRHTEKPFWGLQFHPESICTSDAGKQLIMNWWSHAQSWSAHARFAKTQSRQCLEIADLYSTPRISCSSQLSDEFSDDWYQPAKCEPATFSSEMQVHCLADVAPMPAFTEHKSSSPLADCVRNAAGCDSTILSYRECAAASLQAPDILEALDLNQKEVILLDSQQHATGRYSIIGLDVPGKTMKVTYRVRDKTFSYGFSTNTMQNLPLRSADDVWPILQEVLDLCAPQNDEASSRDSSPHRSLQCAPSHGQKIQQLPEDSPFWGGFMGYISYEAGLETINVDLHEKCAASNTPDINFAFIQRSIVIDHHESRIYIQSLLPGDQVWLDDTQTAIKTLTISLERKDSTEQTRLLGIARNCDAALDRKLATAQVNRPGELDYRGKVLDCQDSLSSGDSYELCLTDESKISIPVIDSRGIDEWALYKRLRAKNPAPFGAFVRLSDVTIVGSSPERFLKWSRDGHCQFRPIKGTVKKGPSMPRERAHEILNSSKERAENLMIVDLIRHDLSGVIGASNTWVSQLMKVEEYQTVYQLVSVIEGELPPMDAQSRGPRGLDVLKASLPPGSMTGAPKKRSCEILRDIEKRPRGVYSGVLGYMDVGGAGDFSVVIRTLVREARGDDKTETWKVGAGGAVTIQSTDEAEFQEMETKASSVLGALFGSKDC